MAPGSNQPARRRWRIVAILAGGAVALWLVAWLVVAVILPEAKGAECTGIQFRSGEPGAQAPSGPRPPIGGTGGIAGKLRSALRGDQPAIYCDDFADPFVLRVGDDYYAYSTNTGSERIPVLTSKGLFGTARRTEALANLPAWSAPGTVWAPSVLARPGSYVLYYATALAEDPERQCLSRATSTEPDGPFVDDSAGPLVCPPGGGAIDASPFVDVDGRAYLLWKSYGGVDGIVAQELTPDGLGLVGPVPVLLGADQGWEAGLIEAPSMLARDGRYYLFYSANDWNTANYAIGFAVCDSPTGPCARPTDGPWLASTDQAQGPGGGEVFSDDQGQPWLVLHAWVRGKVGYPNGARNLFVVRLDFVNGVPVPA